MTIVPIAAGSAAALFLLAAWTGQASAETAIFAPSKDNTLYEDTDGSLSNGSGVNLFAGVTAASLIRRAALSFDVAGQIPAGSVVNSASLALTVTRAAASPLVEISIHALLADWGEGASDAALQEGSGAAAATGDATWTKRFYPNQSWDSPGGDFDPVASAAKTVASLGGYTWSSPALAADVQSWVDNPGDNFGWIVVGDEGGSSTSRRFGSRENADASVRPVLTVDYTPPSTGTLVLTATVSQTAFAPGETLSLGIGAANPGLEGSVDVYLVVLLPDGNTLINFIGLDGTLEFGSLSNLGALTPLVPSLPLAGAFDVSLSPFFSYTWSGSEPGGSYAAVLVMAQPGSLADNSVDPDDLVQLSSAGFTFNP